MVGLVGGFSGGMGRVKGRTDWHCEDGVGSCGLEVVDSWCCGSGTTCPCLDVVGLMQA